MKDKYCEPTVAMTMRPAPAQPIPPHRREKCHANGSPRARSRRWLTYANDAGMLWNAMNSMKKLHAVVTTPMYTSGATKVVAAQLLDDPVLAKTSGLKDNLAELEYARLDSNHGELHGDEGELLVLELWRDVPADVHVVAKDGGG